MRKIIVTVLVFIVMLISIFSYYLTSTTISESDFIMEITVDRTQIYNDEAFNVTAKLINNSGKCLLVSYYDIYEINTNLSIWLFEEGEEQEFNEISLGKLIADIIVLKKNCCAQKNSNITPQSAGNYTLVGTAKFRYNNEVYFIESEDFNITVLER